MPRKCDIRHVCKINIQFVYRFISWNDDILLEMFGVVTWTLSEIFFCQYLCSEFEFSRFTEVLCEAGGVIIGIIESYQNSFEFEMKWWR